MKRKSKRIIFKIFFPLIFTSLFIGFYLFLRSEPLLIKNIIVTTDYDIAANSELVKILENTRNQNIFWLNDKTISEQIKATDLKIKEVLVQKKFPGKILVEIKSRQALAAVAVADKFFLIDKEGLVFDEKKEVAGLPILELGLQNIGLGSRIDENKKNILVILEALKGKEEVVSILTTEEETQMQLGGGTLILFPPTNEINAKLNALQTILDRFRIEGKRPAKIDLRFEKPVVSF